MDLKDRLFELGKKVERNNLWRQRECVNLIPSENTPSLLVKLCEISDPSGRYAEHKKALKKEREAMKGSKALKGDQIYYYQGTDFIYEIEEMVKEEFGKYIGASEVEPRTISGQMANEVVFKAIVKFLKKGVEGVPASGECGRINTVMNNNLNYGGHLSAQPFGALFNMVDGDVVNFPISEDNPYKIDVEKMIELVDEHKPALIVFGKSMFIHREPIRELREFVENTQNYRPVIMYDAAHVMGILGSYFQDPLKEGVDVVTGSTHKTFFGPQRGIIASNMSKGTDLRKLWLEINTRAFPGSTSNHHLGTLLALLVATIEMNHFKDEYQRAVTQNAKSFAKYLKDRGIDIEGDPELGYTETHQVIMRVSRFGDGKDIAAKLEENNIITNYQALPDDETFYHPSGIRMGVQEMTRFGMEDRDFEELAEYIAEVVKDGKNVGEKVKEFRKRFKDMKYTLSLEDSSELAAKIFESVFQDLSYMDLILENLTNR